ncbi:elongation factor P maturation arginine rhamnosyltransferase EarP [Massilia sp. DWR3-1-1]|uniref:elongation factor P maturation arginine rhamnosyltransferase EarP n=1 Tax=Massilia sp. DWR3-1-1 TaxID=2804559 RepID=UPI003CEC6502
MSDFHSSLAIKPPTGRAATLALFCKVVDNFGDIGICWRLARQLQSEHGIDVTLWVDDLPTFQHLCPEIDVHAARQLIAGVTVRHWDGQDGAFTPADVADTVIEFFAVDIPPAYIAAMAACTPRPVWLNLEGMSAEQWVEGCHCLPSTHPRLPLVKHFFFPGFTALTGGLLREAALDAARLRFQADGAAQAAFLARLGVSAAEQDAFKVSLFCYPHAPVAALFEAWQAHPAPVLCLVPHGVATDAVAAFLGSPARVGAVGTRAALTVRVVPFLPQDAYDKLLWACDLNLVRGEDSIVRAQWAGRPFVWHIYPQDENLHHVKLRAFLQRFSPQLDAANALSLHWNGAGAGQAEGAIDWPGLWRQYFGAIASSAERAEQWQRAMADHGDLASNLLRFTETVRAANRSAHQ